MLSKANLTSQRDLCVTYLGGAVAFVGFTFKMQKHTDKCMPKHTHMLENKSTHAHTHTHTCTHAQAQTHRK